MSSGVELAADPDLLTGEPGTPSAWWAVWFAVVALFLAGFLRFGYFYFGDLAEGHDVEALPLLINEMTGAAATIMAFFALIPFVRRYPITRERWASRLGLHVGAFFVTSAAKTTFYGVTRPILFSLAGLEGYDYGILTLRYPMEAFNDVFSYTLLAGGIQVWFFYQEARDRELLTARLQASLARARLQGLQAQLHPHFLFNTLNTISSVMYRSPREADRILSRLSDLLRLHLEAPGRQLVTVEEEMASLELYLGIMEARFPDRLEWSIEVADDARGAEVPSFLLQPLVENAIKHGVSRRADAGRVGVRVERRGDLLHAEVEDDGPGFDETQVAPAGSGLGLRATRERLRHLYGERGSLRLVNGSLRGVTAVVEIPFRPVVEEEDDSGDANG